ncbi:MAG: hypothetical protein AB1792_01195 [Candidatus Zixiibacteriota bacterium]
MPVFSPVSALARPRTERDSEFGTEDRDKVNVTRAVAYSLILPGAGQWYAGAKGRAGVFLVGEAATWTLFGYFRTVSSIKEDSYQSYARVHAGIDPAGKSVDFYRLITFYESRDEYNEYGRLLAPGRPYYPDSPVWDWQWDSQAAMRRYRTLRNQKSEADNRARFTLGAAVVDRLIAAIDAWRTARSANRRARMETSQWKVHLKGVPSLDHPAFGLVLSRQF